jgi:hypothetical protein
MAKLIGRFYFKQAGKGKLKGEFSNNKSTDILTETADLIKNVDDRINEREFIGNYDSTWQENGEPVFAKLRIEYRQETDNKIYSLTWDWDINNRKYTHWGEGMRCGDILIGDYRNFKL